MITRRPGKWEKKLPPLQRLHYYKYRHPGIPNTAESMFYDVAAEVLSLLLGATAPVDISFTLVAILISFFLIRTYYVTKESARYAYFERKVTEQAKLWG